MSERRANLENDNAQADPAAESGKADTSGEVNKDKHPGAAPG